MIEPDLVLFDEPTLIRDEMKARGTAADVVTHDDRITRDVHTVDGHITD